MKSKEYPPPGMTLVMALATAATARRKEQAKGTGKPLRAFVVETQSSTTQCRQYPMRSAFIVAAAIAAIPSLAIAQANPPSPPPPAAPAPPPAHADTPHANAQWNANRFSFNYDDGGCHFVYNYDFKNGDMHLDRRGDCSSVSVPHP